LLWGQFGPTVKKDQETEIPHDQERFGSVEGKVCPNCGEKAKRWTLFGRSYFGSGHGSVHREYIVSAKDPRDANGSDRPKRKDALRVLR
jgi:hypothetical protein